MKPAASFRALLSGIPSLESHAIALARLSVGVFFAISGGNKLFVARHTKEMIDTITGAGIPFPHLAAYVVSTVEFVGGLMLIVGVLTSLAAVVLTIVMITAIATVQLAALPKSPTFFDWLDDFLYLPEVLYIVILCWLVCAGPGKFSVDHLIARASGLSRRR